jgi:hypothetical protein
MTIFNAAAQPTTFVIPLTKIDVERRLVIGVAAEEIKDQAGEVMDYATGKPAFETWSNAFSNATNGLSKGNVRVMHTKVVAGRLDQIGYNDDTKRIEVCAKILDDNEWAKVQGGAYTGFSVGGGYAKRWTDADGNKRYTPIVRELSLVDNPCIPTARFAELVKAHGVVEQLELKGTPVPTFAAAWAARPATFAETWAARPQSFAELHKAWDESKHKRNKGRFAAKGILSQAIDDAKPNMGPAVGMGAGAAIGLGLHRASMRLPMGRLRAGLSGVSALAPAVGLGLGVAHSLRQHLRQNYPLARTQQHNAGKQAKHKTPKLPPNSRMQNGTNFPVPEQPAMPAARAHPVRQVAKHHGGDLPSNESRA